MNHSVSPSTVTGDACHGQMTQHERVNVKKVRRSLADGGALPSPRPGWVSGRAARGVRRLSTISEHEGDRGSTPLDIAEDELWAERSRSLSPSSTSSNTVQPSFGDDCAALTLTCLFCQLSEFFHTVPVVCRRAVVRCFPSCQYLCVAAEPVHDGDCCSCKVDLDCNLLGSCHEATEILELAVEISEVCHR